MNPVPCKLRDAKTAGRLEFPGFSSKSVRCGGSPVGNSERQKNRRYGPFESFAQLSGGGTGVCNKFVEHRVFLFFVWRGYAKYLGSVFAGAPSWNIDFVRSATTVAAFTFDFFCINI